MAWDVDESEADSGAGGVAAERHVIDTEASPETGSERSFSASSKGAVDWGDQSSAESPPAPARGTYTAAYTYQVPASVF